MNILMQSLGHFKPFSVSDACGCSSNSSETHFRDTMNFRRFMWQHLTAQNRIRFDQTDDKSICVIDTTADYLENHVMSSFEHFLIKGNGNYFTWWAIRNLMNQLQLFFRNVYFLHNFLVIFYIFLRLFSTKSKYYFDIFILFQFHFTILNSSLSPVCRSKNIQEMQRKTSFSKDGAEKIERFFSMLHNRAYPPKNIFMYPPRSTVTSKQQKTIHKTFS